VGRLVAFGVVFGKNGASFAVRPCHAATLEIQGKKVIMTIWKIDDAAWRTEGNRQLQELCAKSPLRAVSDPSWP